MASQHPAKKAAAKKSTAKRSAPRRDKPADVGLNFDTWSRDDDVEPFPIVIGGKRYESLDPMDLDYRELTAVLDDDPDEVFRILFPDDHEEILANKISVGAMLKFNEAIVVHFGLEDFIAAQS